MQLMATTKEEAFSLLRLWSDEKRIVAYGARIEPWFESVGSGFINELSDYAVRIGFDEQGPPGHSSSLTFELVDAEYGYAEIAETRDNLDCSLVIKLGSGIVVMLAPLSGEAQGEMLQRWSGN